jgi:hypothetical protein
MIAHRGNRSPELQMVAFEVVATNVIDLREVERLATFDVDARSAPAPWQEDADADGTPDSWRVRDALVSLGASGLIDPSRKRLDLLHLALFAWNTAGAPSVRRLG